MSIDLNQTGIDPLAPEYQAMLDNLQCNILKAHGRDFAAHIFLQFTGSASDVKRWVREFTQLYVTSARRQLEESQAYRANQIPGGMIGSFLLAAEGYRFLGIDVDRFEDQNETFQDGMKHRGFDLIGPLIHTNNRDPLPETWEESYQQTIHAMALLADDDPDTLLQAVDAVVASLGGVAVVLAVEHGNVLRNQQPKAQGKAEPARKGQPIEHFGYADGRSNPLFLRGDIEAEVGTDQWDPSAPLKQVLVPDPHTDVEDSFGSFVVFRKLEQNVRAFRDSVEMLAGQAGIAPELAGAFVIGRFKDGTPVMLQNVDGLGDVNNFAYSISDRPGTKCPFHAHVRKVNPRGTTPFTSQESERSRRIVRRGIPYGKKDDADPPSAGVGLLFICYQSDIHLQWEFIQRTWADNPNFPRNLLLPDTGDDPLIGQDLDANSAQKWPNDWGQPETVRTHFGGYVTLKGGEFFFAPSIAFLRAL